MNRSYIVAVAILFGTFQVDRVHALTTNSWTGSVGGKWETSGNWSAGAPTNTDAADLVTNATSKVVTIDALTPPGNLTVSNLVVSGPAGAVNTLQLTNAPAATLHVLSSLIISNGGALLITNSVLFVGTPNFGNLFDDGTLSLIGGTMIITGAYVAVGNVGTGEMTISTSKFAAGILYVGYNPGSQGTLTVTDGSQFIGTNGFNPVYLGFSGSGQMIISNSTWLAGYATYLGFESGVGGTLTMVGATATLSSFLDVASAFGSTGSVWQTGGQLIATNDTISVGDSGVGQMTVSNGTWRSSDVVVGYALGSSGTLTLIGGTNQIVGLLSIAGQGSAPGQTGSVWVTGGQLITTNAGVDVGDTGIGQMTVSNATWLDSTVEVGSFGNTPTSAQGTLTLVSSMTTISSVFAVGAEDPTATGAVWMTGGQLTATNSASYVGWYGVGQMAVSSGVWRASEVDVGYGASSQGTLTIAGGTNVFSGDVVVGVFPGARGTLWMTGGQLIVTNENNLIWLTEYSAGQMTISNGACLASSLILGDGDSDGTLTMAGGTTTILGDVDVGVEGTQTVWLVGGQLTATNGTTTIGDAGIGRMTISNGLWRARNAVVGLFSGSPGILTVAGGISSVYSNVTIGTTSCSASGVVLITGGELHVTNDAATAVLEVRSGTLIQTDGLLDIDRIVVTNPCAHFIHMGGTLIYGLQTLSPGLDADGDGIPNSYEMANGLDPLDPTDAGLDPDGDGQSNLEEFSMGTDPHDPNSYLHISSITVTNNNVLITWSTATMTGDGLSLEYRVLWGTNMTAGITNILGFVFVPHGTAITSTNYLDVGGATNRPARFYRVKGTPNIG